MCVKNYNQQPLYLQKGWMSRAGRYALSPLLRACRDDQSTTLAPAQRQLYLLEQALKRRQSRLLQLFEQRRWVLDGEDSLNALLRCPLTTAQTKQGGRRPCNRPELCPFCWVRRYTYPLFARVTRALFPSYLTDPPTTDALPPAEIAELHTTHRYDKSEWPLADLWQWAAERKQQPVLHQFKQTFGAFVLSSVAPGDENHWVLRHRALVLVPRNTPHFSYRLPPQPKPPFYGMQVYQRIRRITLTGDDASPDARTERMRRTSMLMKMRREGVEVTEEELKGPPYDPMLSLAAAVGRVTMFDERMLCSPDPEAVADILESRRVTGVGRYRTSDFYGVFRDKAFSGTLDAWKKKTQYLTPEQIADILDDSPEKCMELISKARYDDEDFDEEC